jgi:hypothetical protein
MKNKVGGLTNHFISGFFFNLFLNMSLKKGGGVRNFDSIPIFACVLLPN